MSAFKTGPATMTEHEHEMTDGQKPPARYVPPFPERTMYHWIRRYRGGPAIPIWWNAFWNKNGGEGWGQFAQPDREEKWQYVGPCFAPDEEPSPTENELRAAQWRELNRTPPLMSGKQSSEAT